MKNTTKKLIWDLPVRLFHISIILLIPAAWYTVEISNNMDHHFIIGYSLVTLVMFRLLWGFLGSRYARFANFIYPPKEIIHYAKSLFSSKTKAHTYTGHNPLGGLSVLLLLLLLTIQTITGLFANDEYYYFGPFSGYIDFELTGTITEIHKLTFDILFGFIILHILAVLFYWLIKKQNLIIAMITGRKNDGDNTLIAIKNSKLVFASLLIIACALSVYGISTLGES
jgi:cytochrome b